MRQARWGVLIGAAALLLTASLNATVALAAGTWTVSVTGRAAAASAGVPAGKLPTATVLPTSIKLDWAPSLYPTGREVSAYVVRRQVVGSKDAAQVCSVAAPLRACEDSPPAGQPVVYTVVAAEQLWRGPASAPSSPVTLTAAAPATLTATPVVSPSPSASPSPSPSPSSSASASPAATPSSRPCLYALCPTPSPTP
jgi:hypothetical protein